MMRRLFFLGGVFVVFVGLALTAANVVSSSRVGEATSTLDVDELKPVACAGLDLVGIRTGSGGAGGANALILGTPGNDSLSGGNGDDCIMGGAGNDTLRGNGGVDVCIGGPGTDSFHQSCETVIQD